MVYTTAARIYRGDVRSLHEWVAYVGRDHLHHRLMALGLSQKQTVLAVIGIALATGLGALAMIKAGELSVWLLLGQGFVLYVLLSFIMVLAAERMEKLE
jgi:UDP-GlcNAc:undecaprenyl-phosphate/decaprenyl-phosphate GlcNAc-1-phosphate transferase